jgi:hypothetical protein
VWSSFRRPVATAVLLLALSPGRADPCAPAPPAGLRVAVLGEQALIVWEPEARRQHFVRRASFDSEAPDFGFLVPTPARPELAEAPDAVFDALRAAIQPEVVYRRDWTLQPTLLLLFPFLRTSSLPETAGAPQSVRVLEEKRVAGYDAAVLEADDAAALARWLNQRGYASRPELREWLQPYVQARWIVTAFKVAGPTQEKRLATQAVRMSFAAERPFFPYREPADQRTGPPVPRELRVYVVAPQRMDGAIGTGAAWSRELLYAAPKDDLAALLSGAVPAGSAPRGAWLSAFRDVSSPRPGVDDLFFTPAGSNEKVLPPPIVVRREAPIPLPLDVLVLLALGGVWWRRRSRRVSP